MNHSILSFLKHFLSSLKKLHYFFFPKLLELICKILLEIYFYFAYGLESFFMERIFLMIKTNNNWIEQDLENTENAIECPIKL